MSDYIVLLNEQNQPIGTAPKLEAHNNSTPLHKGFSLFLLNTKGELLLQQRSAQKKAWPNVWSNSCCGHPMLRESAIEAAKRRLEFELGIHSAEIRMMLPNYRYRFEQYGIIENELCPVMAGFSDATPHPNTKEVQAIRWLPWEEWVDEVKTAPENYSPWCVEETLLLEKSETFTSFLREIVEA